MANWHRVLVKSIPAECVWFTYWFLHFLDCPFAVKEWVGNGGEQRWKKGILCPMRDPVLVKQVSYALPLSSVCWTAKVPTRSRTSQGLGAEAGREGSCRSASCPAAGVPGAAVKDFPFLSSPACPLQLGRRPAAGAAGLHGLSARLQMPRWRWEGQDTDSEEVWGCPEASTEVLGFHTGMDELRGRCGDKSKRNAALEEIRWKTRRSLQDYSRNPPYAL